MRLSIISGGQTGVDRAALDAALSLGIPCGGFCPKGRKAEDGPLDSKYPLKETESEDYAVRTEWNVRDSDGTLIITRGKPTGGTAYTIAMTRVHKKPCLVIDLNSLEDSSSPCEDVAEVANDVCHPRESGDLVRLNTLDSRLRGNDTTSATPSCGRRLRGGGDEAIHKIRGWLTQNKIKVLNIAGPRRSTTANIYENAKALLVQVLSSIS